MNTQSRLIPEDIKWFIVAQAEQGYEPKEIVGQIEERFHKDVDEKTIPRILDKYEQTGSVSNAWSGGGLPLFSPSETNKIVKEVRRKKTLIGVDVSRNPNFNIHDASSRTMQRFLNNRGLISSTNIPQHLDDDQKQDRVDFCQEYLEKPDSFWHNALFADESDLAPVKCGKIRIRRYPGEEIEVNMGSMGEWDSRTVKAFGVISSKGVGPLVQYQGTINAEPT